jgi:hypothetical protein
MTIRVKLYAAIAMTVLGPVVTIAAALAGMASLGQRFDDVADRAGRQALALELKFAVTDLNGWQTAYGYDGGRSRPQFERSRGRTQAALSRARARLTDAREVALLRRLSSDLRGFLDLDDTAFAALRAGRTARVRQIFLGPEIARFRGMARAADALAVYEAGQAERSRRAFAADRRDARRRLVAVGLAAGVLIVLLLVTAQDVARAALEQRAPRRAGP